MQRNNLIFIASSVLIAVFAYTALSKYADMESFQNQMLKQPFSYLLRSLVILLLPPVEMVVAAALLSQKTRYYGFIGATILMVAFTIYSGLMVSGFYDKVPCSCGGILEMLNWNEHFIINILLLIISLGGFILERKKRILRYSK